MKFGIDHKIFKGTKSSLRNTFEALDLAQSSNSDLLVILGSSNITPLDLLIGLPERKLIKKAKDLSEKIESMTGLKVDINKFCFCLKAVWILLMFSLDYSLFETGSTVVIFVCVSSAYGLDCGHPPWIGQVNEIVCSLF